METSAPLGWYADPTGDHEQRFFDGRRWTNHVANGGQISIDVELDAARPRLSRQLADARPGPAAITDSRWMRWLLGGVLLLTVAVMGVTTLGDTGSFLLL